MTETLKSFIIGKLRRAFPNHEDVLTDGLGIMALYL